MRTKDALLADLKAVLEDMTSDWDLSFGGEIGADTRLMADLEFESIDVVQFVVAIQERYQRKDLPFEELLMVDGRYVDEIQVADAVDFLHRHLASAGAAAR